MPGVLALPFRRRDFGGKRAHGHRRGVRVVQLAAHAYHACGNLFRLAHPRIGVALTVGAFEMVQFPVIMACDIARLNAPVIIEPESQILCDAFRNVLAIDDEAAVGRD